MTPNTVVIDLIKRHVLWAQEQIEDVQERPDGVVVRTGLRHFTAGSKPADWTVSRHDWVADVLIATRDDLIIHGQPERFGFLIPVSVSGEGEPIFLNDIDQLAQLGRRLPESLDALAYAELVVQFHRYTSAIQKVLTEPEELRRRFDLPDLPACAVQQGAGATVLRFASSLEYRRPVLGRMLDIAQWTVTVPAGASARWESELIAQRIPIDDPLVS